MTAPNPERIRTQDGYDEWLDDMVENEISEFVEYHDPPFHSDQVDVWINESPILSDNDWSWAKLYDDVKRNSYNHIPDMEIVVPAEDPWRKLAKVVRTAMVSDLRIRMEMTLEDRGYEVEQ